MLIHNKDDIELVTEFPCFWDLLFLEDLLTRDLQGVPKTWEFSDEFDICYKLAL